MGKQIINIDAKKLPYVICAVCGKAYFEQLFQIRKVPKFMSGSDKVNFIIVQCWKCNFCGEIMTIEPKMQPTSIKANK